MSETNPAALAEQKEKEFCKGIVDEFDRMVSNRANYDSHCTEIAQRINPNESNLFLSQGNQTTQGEKRNSEIFDATAALALPKFASIIESLVTPSNQVYQKIGTNNPYLQKDREVIDYFEQVTRILFSARQSPEGNFSGQNHMNFLSMGSYGGACMFTDALRTKTGGTRYKSVHLSEIYWDEDHQGNVDKAGRRVKWKLRQIKQAFPNAKLPKNITEDKNPDKEYQIIQMVKPNADYDPTRWDAKGKLYKSCYVLRDALVLLEEGGYDVFPFSIPRYLQVSGEVTGRSPAMLALPAVKTLNAQKKTLLKQGQRATDPVMFAHDDGVLDAPSLKPGAFNYGGVNEDGKLLVHTMPVGRVDIGKDMMDVEKADIQDAFLITLFQILIESPNMSATEVMERAKEKAMLLVPTVGRLQTEYLSSMTNRELEILRSQRKLPPMPQVLIEAEGEYNITYDSPISKAQRAGEAAGIARTIESTLAIVNVTQDPAPLDHFEFDVIVPELAEINGVPQRWLKDPRKVMQIREGRAEHMQNEQNIQAAPAMASVAKTLEGAKQ